MLVHARYFITYHWGVADVSNVSVWLCMWSYLLHFQEAEVTCLHYKWGGGLLLLTQQLVSLRKGCHQSVSHDIS